MGLEIIQRVLRGLECELNSEGNGDHGSISVKDIIIFIS